MSTTTGPTPATAAEPALPRRRWTEVDFARMVQAGLLREGDGTYLEGGDVLDATAGGDRHRWTEEEADRLVEIGIVREGGREFLWDGEFIEPMPEDLPHVNAADHAGLLMRARFAPDEWTIYSGNPGALKAGFLPQPDLAVISGPRSSYRKRRPAPGDIALLVEVTNTTYRHDSGSYLQEYARAAIPQYWIANIRARRVEVYTDPTAEPPGYRIRRDFGLDDVVPVAVEVAGRAIDREGIAVREVLQDSLDEA